jgi:hypothetical protein
MPKWLFSNQFAFGPTGSIMAALFFVLQHVLVKLIITTCMKLSSNQFCSLPLFAVLFNNQLAFRHTDNILAALFLC